MLLPLDESPVSEPLTGLVLAGGRSSRFGSDKSLHRVGNVTLRAVAGAKLREVCDRVVLSLPHGVDVAVDPPFDAVVTDLFPDAGPLAGIHAAMRNLAGRILVVPCDMPDVTVDTLRRLASAPYQAASVAIHGGRAIGVLACYPDGLLDELAERLRAGGAALRVADFVRALPVVEFIELPDAEARNVNRVSDLAPPAAGP